MLGSRGRGPALSHLLGSVGLSVVRHAACPVVVHRPGHPGRVRDGVVVAVDATEDSIPVLEFAFRQASLRRLPIRVLHYALDPRPALLGVADGGGLPEPGEWDVLGLAEAMAGLGERYPDVHSSVRTAPGVARAGRRPGGEPRGPPGRRHPPTRRAGTPGGRLGLDRDPRACEVPGGRRAGAVVMSLSRSERAGPPGPAASSWPRASQVGRVAVCTEEGPRILPVNYVVDGASLVFRTSPYGLLGRLASGGRIAFEVDDIDRETRSGWSVVATGRAEPIEDADELTLLRAFRDPQPWAPGLRLLYLRLRGRRSPGSGSEAPPGHS